MTKVERRYVIFCAARASLTFVFSFKMTGKPMRSDLRYKGNMAQLVALFTKVDLLSSRSIQMLLPSASLAKNVKRPHMIKHTLIGLVSAVCSVSLAGSPPAVNGQPMRMAGPAEAAKAAKCIVVATPIKPVSAGTWSFTVDKWLRGSGPSAIEIRGFFAPGFGGTSLDASAAPGRTVLAMLGSCDGPPYAVLGPFVTPEGRWVPTGVYEPNIFDGKVSSE